ncbi:unnamed protein product [Cylindrotheca closterium]|uniref:DUF6824 domain-containing protein n=1 Tax=Cylindrotheca closterium TaxID=2856 RepID=A0AAD2PUG3_9STRA|nr:unnamed protein product [Cylindrotheca closterium]
MPTTLAQDQDEKKEPLKADSTEKIDKMLHPETNENTHSNVQSQTKRAQLHQTISGATATSVAALRRSGLKFTDVDDPNALRVQNPGPGDILFGRGRGFQEHPGNQRMLKIISKYKQAYKSQKRSKKREFVEAVYDEITRDGSRFLKKLEGENCWVEVSIPISLEKVSHTLRGKRKGEEELTPASTEADASDQLLHLQKRQRAHSQAESPNGGTPMGKRAPTNNRLQGLGGQLLPSLTSSMGASTMAPNGAHPSLQNAIQSALANQQFGAAASQRFQSNGSVFSSMTQGHSAFNGFPQGASSNYGNPYMLEANFYGVPQMAGGGSTNPALGVALGVIGGGGAGSMFGASSLYGGSALDAARFEFLREQQQQFVKASAAGSNNALLALQGGGLQLSNSSSATITTPPTSSKHVEVAISASDASNTSRNKATATS